VQEELEKWTMEESPPRWHEKHSGAYGCYGHSEVSSEHAMKLAVEARQKWLREKESD
jgi:hypothetical protein